MFLYLNKKNDKTVINAIINCFCHWVLSPRKTKFWQYLKKYGGDNLADYSSNNLGEGTIFL